VNGGILIEYVSRKVSSKPLTFATLIPSHLFQIFAMLNYADILNSDIFEAIHQYANQLLLHANGSAPQPGTPPYGYLEWALINNDCIVALIPSN